jgi:hypothetical protein
MARHYIILKLFSCALLAASASRVCGQQAKPDSLQADTIKKSNYIPTGIRIGTDVISLVKSRAQANYTGWEVNGEIDFSRYYLAIDYGRSGRNLNAEAATYSNDGKFWRVGVDVNFLRKDPDGNMFFIGTRYGHSNFSETLSLNSSDPNWGTLTRDYNQSDVNARWLELTSGIRVKIWKIFWLGYTGRLKFALKTDASPEMLPYDVPGFGRTDKETSWGFNYYVMIRLPIRKAPLPVVKK